jgi:hypothetical protein
VIHNTCTYIYLSFYLRFLSSIREVDIGCQKNHFHLEVTANVVSEMDNLGSVSGSLRFLTSSALLRDYCCKMVHLGVS